MIYTLTINALAPNFSLLATDGLSYSLDDFSNYLGLVIFFSCNHCPYVIQSDPIVHLLAKEYEKRKIKFVAINSNSPNTYPEDSFEEMKKRMSEYQFCWTYLVDRNQTVAKSYGALKTPHFFLFNKERRLIYTGRALENPKDPLSSKENNLRDALHQYVNDKQIAMPVTNPKGCNIKWEGKPSHWMPEEACDLI